MFTAARILIGSLWLTVRFPRVVALAYLLISVPAAMAVWSVWRLLDSELATHPGAETARGWRLDLGLDPDFVRQHPDVAVSLAGGVLFALVAFAFLGGGVLMSVRSGRPFEFGEFLANGGRMLFRNLRVLVCTAVAGVVLALGQSAYDHYVVRGWLLDVPTGSVVGSSRVLSLEFGLEAVRYLFGVAFVWLILVSKLAMARLAIYQTNSSIAAWFSALGKAMRRPITSGSLAALLAVAWLAGSHVTGELLVRTLEVGGTDGSLWLPFAIGQVGILWTQVVVVASWIAARRLLADNRKGGAGEPIVQVRTRSVA